jgi:multidrug resistance efflux pump
MVRKLLSAIVLFAALGAGAYYYLNAPPPTLVLTGVITTHDVAVSSQVTGQITRLLVAEGDTVTKGQVIAEIAPEELKADEAYYAHSVDGLESSVAESEATLRYQQQAMTDQVRQSEARIATIVAQQAEAAADLAHARSSFERQQELSRQSLATAQQLDDARAAFDLSTARVDTLTKQIDVERAALALVRASSDQVAARRNQVNVARHQLAAAGAQRAKAEVRTGYTQIRAPLDGKVDVLVHREGEIVTAAQPIVTLIDPSNLWVRADVEETYIDRVKEGDVLTVRLPSGEERKGTVFYRRADAAYATQRDVSRTKRDIKTFETRLRVDDPEHRLAVGMSTYVLLPVEP